MAEIGDSEISKLSLRYHPEVVNTPDRFRFIVRCLFRESEIVSGWVKQELLENILNTRDFTTYSPAELLYRVRDTYEKARREYTNMIREYSYNHGDLTNLHI